MQYLGRTEVEIGLAEVMVLWPFVTDFYVCELHVLHGIPTEAVVLALFFGAPLVTSQVHKLSHVTSHRREC